MICGNSSSQNILSPQQQLGFANVCLSSARAAKDLEIALELCSDAESALSRMKRALSIAISSHKSIEETIHERVSATYYNLGKLQDSLGQSDRARTSYKNAEQWHGLVQKKVRPSQPAAKKTLSVRQLFLSMSQREQDGHQTIRRFFLENIRPPINVFKLPEAGERVDSTPQLAYCLGLMQSTEGVLEAATRDWLQATLRNTEEQERLMALATDVVRQFKRDNRRDPAAITEVLYLVPVLEKDTFRSLLMEFYTGIDQSDLLDIHQLEGIARLIKGAKSGYLNADDLIKLLELLRARLMDTYRQSPHYIYQLTATLCHVLDAMADTSVGDLDREKLREPLMAHLDELKRSSDTYMVFQAVYIHQALQYVPDNVTPWQRTLRRTGKVVQGVSGLATAVKGLDLNRLLDGLKDIQQGTSGTKRTVRFVKTAHKDVTLLVGEREDFMDAMKKALSFDHKREWYLALRGADVFIREGQLVKFERLVYEAPCRSDPAFQWGVCQQLGEIAANNYLWDEETRRSAVMFLGEIYRNDAMWGQQSSVKQWILRILLHLASQNGSVAQDAVVLLQELEKDGDSRKQKLYRECSEEVPTLHRLKFDIPALSDWAILDRVQKKLDVEQSLRQLKRRRINGREGIIYIPQLAKASLQAPDESRFPLKNKVNEFLNGEQTVLLLLGDSGSGKSTFNRALEFNLWQSSNKRTSAIPLFINLSSIDRPDQDLVAKQLRKLDFTEPQIRELKYRQFILICDGYDESLQTCNLYKSNRLNEEGEWMAKMVISCRSEYVGSDYRSQFEPGDCNQQSGQKSLFQEAVIMPFSARQIVVYIKRYVDLFKPLWKMRHYMEALNVIPGLFELVKNPFLLTMSLEVLPRMMDPDEHSSATSINKVSLYDHFIEQWLERGKRRLEGMNLRSQSRSAFDSLCDEGFIMNGIDFLKKLSVAIYKEQDGQPIVEYSCFNDEGTWKADFFGRNEEKMLLCEACPLVRSGNQYRFIHRSILEYGLARAIYDPQDHGMKSKSEPSVSRRGSTSSVWSFEVEGGLYKRASNVDEKQPVDSDSPLVWKNLVNEPSILRFLSERVELERDFQEQLLSYIELSKKDKYWRTAAANAITILVRAGVQFIDKDLQGIRIPGADLSSGVFDSVRLQDADLRKVNLQGVRLRQTDLSRAQMTGVQLGESPFLTEDSGVLSCAYSPDGVSFVTATASGVIHVYSTLTLERTGILSGHSDRVRCVVYSPKGNQVASSSEDMTVRLWNMETGLCQYILMGHDDWVRGVAYSPQGDTVASASDDGTIQIWNAITGEPLQTLDGHIDYVECVAYSPKGNQIASGGSDLTVRIWDVAAGKHIHDLPGHVRSIVGIIYSPQGDVVASASGDGTVRLWDLETGACRHVLNKLGRSALNGIAYSPKGNQLASAAEDGTVQLWDAESGDCLQTLARHNDSVKCVAFSPTGDQLASGGMDETVHLWNVSTGLYQSSFNGHNMTVMTAKISPKGDMIVSGSVDTTTRFWDAKTGICRTIWSGHTEPVTTISFSPQDNCIATGSSDNSVRIWDLATGVCQLELSGHSDRINAIAYSPEGDQLVSASDDWTLRLWDTLTGECIDVLHGHMYDVLTVAYSPDGTRIASGDSDSVVRLWDLTDEVECYCTLENHKDRVSEVIFSPQGDQLASASGDKTVKLWDVETGECCMTLTGHSDRVSCIAYSVEGDLLASGCHDKTVRLWDVATGQCRVVVQGIEEGIRGIAMSSAHGIDYVVAAGIDGSVLVWDILEEGTRYRQRWVVRNRLTATDATIQDVSGLTLCNKQHLMMRGAKGEPA